MDYRNLLDIAINNLKCSYSPYSKVKVSACLLCENDRVYKGVNVENASFGATICAERSAFVSAISNGEKSFKAIAITSNLTHIISPCGICRQFMSEFVNDLDVILGDENNYKVYKLCDLLPLSFGKDDM